MKSGMTILVIGGNAAGAAAAAKAKRVNPIANVILFEQSNYISTGTCELPYVLSGEIDDLQSIVFFDSLKFEDEKKVKVLTNHQVVEINPRAKAITVHSLKNNILLQYDYDKLILSTGAGVKNIPQLPRELTNVSTLKTVQDVIRIKKFIDSSKLKRVCIVGSGFIGLEAAEAMHNLGFEVFIMELGSEPLPSADKEIRQLVKNTLVEKGINFLGNTGKMSYKTGDSKFAGIISEGRTIEFDFAINCTGFAPNNSLARQAKLDLGKFGGIKVNNRLQTSERDIYACGDCIEISNFITHKNDYIPLATFAQREGHIAGDNAAGGNAYMQPVIKNISVKICDNYLAQVGLGEESLSDQNITYATVEATVPNLVKVMRERKPVYGKVLFDRSLKKIYGASFFGGTEVSGYADLISTYIRNNIPITQLSAAEYNYTPPLSPFINLMSVIGRKSTSIK